MYFHKKWKIQDKNIIEAIILNCNIENNVTVQSLQLLQSKNLYTLAHTRVNTHV